jgi:hypothetical protein
MNIQYEIELDAVSLWIQKSLNDPLALAISRNLAQSLHLAGLKFYTFARHGLSENELFDFSFGGKVSVGFSADEWLVDFVEKTSCGKSNGFWLVEDWLARPKDSTLSSTPMPAVFHGDQVYYVIDIHSARSDRNWRRICSNRSPLFHAFILQGISKPPPGLTMSGSYINKLTKHVCLMVFGLYDGESYLVAAPS